jgi:hypothetical protein
MNRGGYENPEYPWQQIERSVAQSQLLRGLQRAQDEQLKEQELGRGMLEQKAREQELFHSMLVRQLQGWQPPPGVDVGGFSQGGAPMQYKAIGPGTQGPQNIQRYDDQWSKQPELSEEMKLKFRQYMFPKATTPEQLQLPSEREEAVRKHDVMITDRQEQAQNRTLIGAEKRAQSWQEHQKQLKEQEDVVHAKAAAKAEHQKALRAASKAADDEVRVLNSEYTKLKMDPMNRSPETQRRLFKERQLAAENIRMNSRERILQINEEHGVGPQRSEEVLQRTRRFSNLSPGILTRLGIGSINDLEQVEKKHGIPIDTQLQVLELEDQKEAQSGKSK